MRILVEVANGRLSAEVIAALERAGHTLVRGTRDFDLALVGSAEAAATLRRERPATAIIVVTKLGDVPARVRALEAGADDAFDPGFAMSQMVARVDAAGRRAAMTPSRSAAPAALARCDREELARHHERSSRQPVPVPRESRAMAASAVAMAKHVVEAPILRALSPVELDSARAQQLHARVAETFARGTPWTLEALVAWIYRDLFLMPPEDPFLGLDVPDPV